MSIVAVGSLAYDSLKTIAGERERILGGSLTHFSNAASLLSKPKLVGVVGEDFGQTDWNFIQKVSSDTKAVEMLKGEKTFFWKGEYAEDFNTATTITTELNAFAKFKPVVPESYKEKDYLLFLANIDPTLQKEVAGQCKDAKLIMMDSMNFWIRTALDRLQETIKEVNGLFVSEGEAVMMTGETNLIKAAEKLFQPHFKLLVLKKGSHGVYILTKDYVVSMPSFPVKEVVDPTGAGDSFAGAFFSYLDANKAFDLDRDAVKQACAYATVVASFSVQGFGVEGIRAADSEMIRKRMKEFRDIASF